jgi:hypothetical protein
MYICMHASFASVYCISNCSILRSFWSDSTQLLQLADDLRSCFSVNTETLNFHIQTEN